MSATYYTLLTVEGAAEWARAESGAIDNVPITHFAVGDGNGAPIEPNALAEQLTNEVHRVPVSSLAEDPEHPNWLIVEAVIPSNVGGWTVREIGLIGGAGAGNKLLAIGNFPATEKTLPDSGIARDLLIRMVIMVSNTSVVELTVDPAIAVATQEYVGQRVSAHEALPDPHPQYIEALIAHVEQADPHPGYLTSAEGAAICRRISYFMGQI